jgi:Protein of unknown function (DUF4233)
MMQRRLCAAILMLEAVVLGLSATVLRPVEGFSVAAALSVGLGLALACLLVAGLLRFEWAYYVGWGLQVAAVALGFMVTVMFALGLIFLALWITAVRLGATIDRDQTAARSAQ